MTCEHYSKEDICDTIIRQKTRLIKIAWSILKSGNSADIEDCFQNLFVTALESYEKIKRHPCLEGWLIKTMSNIAHDVKRNMDRDKHRTVSADESENMLADSSFEEKLIEDMSCEKTDMDKKRDEILSKLSAKESRLYRMRFTEKRSYTEIASIIDASEGSVRAQISKLKKKIKDIVYDD